MHLRVAFSLLILATLASAIPIDLSEDPDIDHKLATRARNVSRPADAGYHEPEPEPQPPLPPKRPLFSSPLVYNLPKRPEPTHPPIRSGIKHPERPVSQQPAGALRLTDPELSDLEKGLRQIPDPMHQDQPDGGHYLPLPGKVVTNPRRG
jgi:hypothetical protein